MIKECKYKNYYQHFDDLLCEEKAVREYVAANFADINNKMDVRFTKFSGPVDWLGALCPSLIIDKTTSGYKKGRMLNSKPNGEEYTVYEFDENMRPLRIKHYNQFGCDATYYFLDIENATFAVPFAKDSNGYYPTYSHKMEYQNNRIKRYTFLYSGQMWQEIYDYEIYKDGSFLCEQYYYVPGLTGSSKSVPIGDKRSPAQLTRMRIFLDKGRVSNILVV